MTESRGTKNRRRKKLSTFNYYLLLEKNLLNTKLGLPNERGEMVKIILFTCVIVGILLRFPFNPETNYLGHDSSLTMSAAMGNHGKLDSLLSIAKKPENDLIVRDFHNIIYKSGNTDWFFLENQLTKFDKHPPLYFWLLGNFLKNINFSDVRIGVFLNLLLSLIIMRLAIIIARTLDFSIENSTLASCFWFLSYTAINTSLFIRQYELLNLIVSLTLLIAVIIDKKGLNLYRGVCFALLLLLGMLTQYSTFIWIITLGIYAIFSFIKWGKVHLIKAFIFSIPILLLFHLFHPSFFDQFGNSALPDIGFIARIKKMPFGIFSYFTSNANVAKILMILTFIFSAYLIRFKRNYLNDAISNHFLKIVTLSFLLLYSSFYLLELLPMHSYGHYYFSGFWVLFSLLLVRTLEILKEKKITPILVMFIIIGVNNIKLNSENSRPMNYEAYNTAIFTFSNRGDVLRNMMRLPPDMKVIIDDKYLVDAQIQTDKLVINKK
ncbi:MAG: glycosyltransferase family 39 protein [Reichenbachiella sp.]